MEKEKFFIYAHGNKLVKTFSYLSVALNDVLISNYGNSVLLASMLNLYHNV